MGRLVLFEQFLSLFRISARKLVSTTRPFIAFYSPNAHLRSPSLELANTHVSPGFLPKRELAGSVSMMCLIALPTRPVPPVTKITDCDIGMR